MTFWTSRKKALSAENRIPSASVSTNWTAAMNGRQRTQGLSRSR